MGLPTAFAESGENDHHRTNQIPRHNPDARRALMADMAELGLKTSQDKTTGLRFLKLGLEGVRDSIEMTMGVIKDVIMDLPNISIITAGISHILPLLENYIVQEDMSRNGLIYVTYRLRYYTSMEYLVLPKGELASQWPLHRVLDWLQANNFSSAWRSTFRALDLHGNKFLEVGSANGGRGNFGMLHQLVYPRLAAECISSGTGWDQPRERLEGRRLRRLIRGIARGEPPAELSTLHVDDEKSLTYSLLDLYRHIMDFLVQNILDIYCGRTKKYPRGIINYRGWNRQIREIKEMDKALIARWQDFIPGSNLQDLSAKASQAEQWYEDFRKSFDLMDPALERMYKSPESEACLQDLRTTNPCDDKDRIVRAQGGLEDVYRWVFDNDKFRQWRNNPEYRLLWVKGDPGMGKTMLLCAIIDELKPSATGEKGVTDLTTFTSFFFCQANDSRLNSATAVLRGIIYMLVHQQPRLQLHIWDNYDRAGKPLFTEANAWEVMSNILVSIIEDPCLKNTYVVIDALDECITNLNLLLDLIIDISAIYHNVKWMVSSRNSMYIDRAFSEAKEEVTLSLDLKQYSSEAVTAYLKTRVGRLAEDSHYSHETEQSVQDQFLFKANGNLLWVELMCAALAELPGPEAEKALLKAPSDLQSLYGWLISNIFSSQWAETCKGILAMVLAVHRPLTLDESSSLADIPLQSSGGDNTLEEIIAVCGSFLVTQERTITFRHPTARDFLLEQMSKDIFPRGISHTHYNIFTRSIQIMSRSLKRNIYGLQHPGTSINAIERPQPDPLTPIQYSCVYWVDHLLECTDHVGSNHDLRDGGTVPEFLTQSYLYWLEALSLLGNISRGVLSMSKLEEILQVIVSPASVDREIQADRTLGQDGHNPFA